MDIIRYQNYVNAYVVLLRPTDCDYAYRNRTFAKYSDADTK